MPPVKPKPLHRSVTFWSGILVMGFICWAWRDSCETVSVVAYRELRSENAFSGVSITRERVMLVPAFWGRLPPTASFDQRLPRAFFIRGNNGMRPDTALLSEASLYGYHRITKYEGPPELWALFIPHWLLLLTVALPWSALLLWRARRWKRAVERIF
jgi:hypothetical protein